MSISTLKLPTRVRSTSWKGLLSMKPSTSAETTTTEVSAEKTSDLLACVSDWDFRQIDQNGLTGCGTTLCPRRSTCKRTKIACYSHTTDFFDPADEGDCPLYVVKEIIRDEEGVFRNKRRKGRKHNLHAQPSRDIKALTASKLTRDRAPGSQTASRPSRMGWDPKVTRHIVDGEDINE